MFGVWGWSWKQQIKYLRCQQWCHRRCSSITGSLRKVIDFICPVCINPAQRGPDEDTITWIETVTSFQYFGDVLDCTETALLFNFLICLVNIKLEIPVRQEEYDDSNALVLPSKKRRSKTLSTNTEKVKVLTKKQKHNLEKIVQRKEKRLQRGELLRQLEIVKASSNELSQMISTADMQSGKLEKKLHPDVGAMKQLSKLSGDVFDDVSYKSYKKIEMKENFRSCDTDVDTSDISTDDEENANNSSNEKVQIQGSKMNISKDGDNNDFVCEKSNHENKDLKDIAKDIGSSELRKTVNIPVFRDPEIEVKCFFIKKLTMHLVEAIIIVYKNVCVCLA
ncbi:hypothetical protein HELRODRAFT_169241 [Helobdella robusta]|uniref:Uncharacterized protein n=1 Tax=Helobdella robusta TaxID=6412 RepID=T1F1M4_HELRO|nr:hypothetical protein HELRODRAFT_169241 [Helobdella robusta]ESO08406.1 hypothetical protein HELRODRAFT_169241 [Helobdella robusta]